MNRERGDFLQEVGPRWLRAEPREALHTSLSCLVQTTWISELNYQRDQNKPLSLAQTLSGLSQCPVASSGARRQVSAGTRAEAERLFLPNERILTRKTWVSKCLDFAAWLLGTERGHLSQR